MTLLAIGGAIDYSGSLPGEFLRLCGSPAARVVILPTASELEDAGEGMRAALTTAGLTTPATILPLRQRADASNQDICAALEEADGIFITGGDQLRLTAAVLGTPAEAALQRVARRGCVIAGTSAGAAALGQLMIARGTQGQAPRYGSAVLTPGLNLEPRILFDQHFNQRNRLGRLIFSVTTNPQLIGVGVDENTAAVLHEDTLEVRGEGAVTIVDASRLTAANLAQLKRRDLLAVSGITLHVLTRGSRFHLRQRTAEIPDLIPGGA